MGFTEWIKDRLADLQAIISPDFGDPTRSDAGDGSIRETVTPEKLSLEFSSDPINLAPVRKSIERFSGRAGLDGPATDEIGLVVNEALANVTRHAYEGAKDKPIQLFVDKIENGVKITIRDWGNGVNPMRLPPKDHDPLIPGGLGLICLRRLMDDVKYEPQRDGMMLTITRTTVGSKLAEKSEVEKMSND